MNNQEFHSESSSSFYPNTLTPIYTCSIRDVFLKTRQNSSNPATFLLSRTKSLVNVGYFSFNILLKDSPPNNMFLSLLWYIRYSIMVPCHRGEPRICSDYDVESARSGKPVLWRSYLCWKTSIKLVALSDYKPLYTYFLIFKYSKDNNAKTVPWSPLKEMVNLCNF